VSTLFPTEYCPKCFRLKWTGSKHCRKCHDYSTNTLKFQLKPRPCRHCGENFKPRAESLSKAFCCKTCWYQWLKAHPEAATWRAEMGRKVSATLQSMPSKFRRKRVDDNQEEIAETFLKCGASVLSLSQVGGGVPDLVVAYAGETFLVEVKNRKTSYGRRGLSFMQDKFAKYWKGKLFMVSEIDEVLPILRSIVSQPVLTTPIEDRTELYRQSAKSA